MTLFLKFTFSFHFFGVGFWFLIGWLTPSSEGLSCYDCTYQKVSPSSSDACLDPVKDNAPTITCPSNSTYCMKRTETLLVDPSLTIIKLERKCDDGPDVCKTNTKIIIPLPEVNNGQAIFDVKYPESIRNWKFSDGFQSVSTRTCKSDNCNDEPGQFTTVC